MAEIGVERLAAGDDEEHRAERDQADLAVARNELDRIERIDRGEHAADRRRCAAGPMTAMRDEPDHHDRPEERRDLGGAAALHREQRDQDHDRERHDVVLERRRHELQTLDRRQHRDRRRDHRVAEEHRRADHAEQEHERRAPAERAGGERGERQRAALPVVVGAQQHQDVFDRDDDDQRPQDHRQHAEHGVAGHWPRRRRGHAPPRGTRRAGWCRCRHRRRRRCRASAPRRALGLVLSRRRSGGGTGRLRRRRLRRHSWISANLDTRTAAPQSGRRLYTARAEGNTQASRQRPSRENVRRTIR